MSFELRPAHYDAVLCYVRGSWAYFTTAPLSEQWGDDWNDAPYEHNAGAPYAASKSYSRYDHATKSWIKGSDYTDGVPNWEVIKIAYDANLQEPDECGSGNSPYSVQDINSGATPWLHDRYGGSGVKVMAGTSLRDFIQIIEQFGGTIYLPRTADNFRARF